MTVQLQITGDSDVEIEELTSSLKAEYNNKIDDLGEMERFLGMRVQRDRENHILSIDHSRYITDIGISPICWRSLASPM